MQDKALNLRCSTEKVSEFVLFDYNEQFSDFLNACRINIL